MVQHIVFKRTLKGTWAENLFAPRGAMFKHIVNKLFTRRAYKGCGMK